VYPTASIPAFVRLAPDELRHGFPRWGKAVRGRGNAVDVHVAHRGHREPRVALFERKEMRRVAEIVEVRHERGRHRVDEKLRALGVLPQRAPGVIRASL